MGNSPSPILMQIRDLMKLPNDFRVHATDCFLMGEGLAELSSERVQIRGVNISCVRQNGTAVDMTIKGFVAGEDGKAGMRGPVVMKEGAMLARSLLAGFVSGISRAFMPFQQGFVISSSPSQAFTFPPAGQLAMAGVAGGAGNVVAGTPLRRDGLLDLPDHRDLSGSGGGLHCVGWKGTRGVFLAVCSIQQRVQPTGFV